MAGPLGRCQMRVGALALGAIPEIRRWRPTQGGGFPQTVGVLWSRLCFCFAYGPFTSEAAAQPHPQTALNWSLHPSHVGAAGCLREMWELSTLDGEGFHKAAAEGCLPRSSSVAEPVLESILQER